MSDITRHEPETLPAGWVADRGSRVQPDYSYRHAASGMYVHNHARHPGKLFWSWPGGSIYNGELKSTGLDALDEALGAARYHAKRLLDSREVTDRW